MCKPNSACNIVTWSASVRPRSRRRPEKGRETGDERSRPCALVRAWRPRGRAIFCALGLQELEGCFTPSPRFGSTPVPTSRSHSQTGLGATADNRECLEICAAARRMWKIF